MRVSREISQQAACVWPDFLPPLNNTVDLFDNFMDEVAVDYTAGEFFKGISAHSSAVLDTANTKGYKDANILLAIEDLETKADIVTSLPWGERLKFFVGMAHAHQLQLVMSSGG